MYDRQSAVFVRRFQIFEQRVEAEKPIQRNSFAFLDGDARTRPIVAGVLERSHHVQAISAPTQKNHHQRVVLVAITVRICLERSHTGSAHLERR